MSFFKYPLYISQKRFLLSFLIPLVITTSSCSKTGNHGKIDLPQESHLIIYFDGPVKDGVPFISPNRMGQPGARYIVRERDGSITHFFLDVGARKKEFDHNRRIDLESLSIPEKEKRADFLVFSHTHPIFYPEAFLRYVEENPELKNSPFYAAISGPIFSYNDGGGLETLLKENPDLKIYVPELKNFTYDMLPPVWKREKLLDRVIQLEKGWTKITDRVGVITTPFIEPEQDYAKWLGYNEAYENLIVVSMEDGYLIHSACAHFPAFKVGERTPHPIEAIRSYIPHSLPDKPVKILLTGGCDFFRIAAANKVEPWNSTKSVFSNLKEVFPSLELVVPVHCGLGQFTFCQEVFGSQCRRGDPGEIVIIRD